MFWDNIFARPDVQTEYFNDVFAHNEETDHFKYHSDKDRQFRTDASNKYARANENSLNVKGLLPKLLGADFNVVASNKSSSSSDQTKKEER